MLFRRAHQAATPPAARGVEALSRDAGLTPSAEARTVVVVVPTPAAGRPLEAGHPEEGAIETPAVDAEGPARLGGTTARLELEGPDLRQYRTNWWNPFWR